MRVLITGAAGQLGRDLVGVWGDHHEVVACGREQLDLADRDSVLSAICSVQPDAVVHAGAWTAVDACETDPDRAFRVNALGTRHVADGARIAGARVCYLSTDYVFDGKERERPYTEWDEPNPVSVYGRSKLGGERELDMTTSTVVRTSWVCGLHGKNFVKTMLRMAGERESWGVVADQRGCPTFTADLAQMVRRLVVGRLAGVFHVSNEGETTWFELARATLEYAALDPGRIQPITTADYPTPAPRPAYSVLDNAALRLQGIPLLPDWHESLERLVKELTSQ